jgi:hypothetical protein
VGFISKPTFTPDVPPIAWNPANVGYTLQIIAGSKLGFAAASGGGGGGFPARYTSAPSAGTYNNVNPGSGWPNTDTGARLIVTPTGAIVYTGLLAGNDGEQVLLWNNAAVGSGFNITLDNLNAGSSAANQFTIAGSALVLPPQARSILVYDATLALWSAG